MTALYLEKKDPVVKAHRCLEKKKGLSSRRIPPQSKNKRPRIPAAIRHEVIKRDNGQCTYREQNEKRCGEKKWIDLHHKQPVADGGEHSVSNIVTVCRQHHQFHHQLML